MRQAIDSGGWFETESAQHWDEAHWWNGSNHISCATGDQWVHETLYRTARGAWILHRCSQWQGSRPSWNRVTASEAAEWLTRNEHPIPDDLAEAAASLEV